MRQNIYLIIAYNGASYEDAEYRNICAVTRKRDALKWIDSHPLRDNYSEYFGYGGFNSAAKYIIEPLFLYS